MATSMELSNATPWGPNFRVADQPEVVNTPLPTNVYYLVGILRAWPGPAIEVTCSRRDFDPGL